MYPLEDNDKPTNNLQPLNNAYSNSSHTSMRNDVASAQAVEIGIHLQEVLTTRDAAKFLKDNLINLEVALRVLLYPARRRRLQLTDQYVSASIVEEV